MPVGSPAPTLTPRELNRATLARQLLLQRHDLPVAEAVGQLAGLQSQEARPPFVGLWTRLRDFTPDQLRAPLHDRTLVRATWVRATLHTITAHDYRDLRAAVQPALTAAMSVLGDRSDGLDVEALIPVAREILSDGPLTFAQLRPLLQERFPDVNDRALGYATRVQLPLVMVPTSDPWSFPATAAFTPASAWIDGPIGDDPDPRPLVRRYLAAFGPATAADAQTWSGLTGLASVMTGMGDELVRFRDERGRALYDLPDAPRPAAAVDAPARLLPEFDNLVLGHSDRTRVLADEHRPRVITRNLRVRATFLVDGAVAGVWTVDTRRGMATLTLAPFTTLPRAASRDLRAEAQALLALIAPDAKDHAVAMGAHGT